MEHNTIIDDNKSPEEIAAAFKANHKKYLVWAIVLLLLCSILVLITSAWTTPGSLNDRLYLAIMGTLVGLPMMAAIFALFFSFLLFLIRDSVGHKSIPEYSCGLR